jgi:hypothetical protein
MRSEFLSALAWLQHTSAQLRSAPTATTTILPMLVRLTATTALTGSPEEYSSARAPGSMAITGRGITAGLASMAADSTAGVTTDVAMDVVSMGDLASLTAAEALKGGAASEVAMAFMGVEVSTVAVISTAVVAAFTEVEASTVAEATAADTGNSP